MARAASSPRSPLSLWRLTLPALALSLLLPALMGCLRNPTVTQTSTLTYEGPQTYTLKPGDLLPGTDIRYLRQSSEGAEFAIGDQRAVKQKADSLNWSGSPTEGVKLDLRLRIVWFTQDALYAAGTARVAVSDIRPQAAEVPTEAPMTYQMPVTYALQRGSAVPGTTLTYEGQAAEGARFAGIEGYPYRQPGDSVSWQGQLRPNVAVREDLRLLHYDERSARLVGVVHLWVTP